jgi:hypothetical protein
MRIGRERASNTLARSRVATGPWRKRGVPFLSPAVTKSEHDPVQVGPRPVTCMAPLSHCLDPADSGAKEHLFGGMRLDSMRRAPRTVVRTLAPDASAPRSARTARWEMLKDRLCLPPEADERLYSPMTVNSHDLPSKFTAALAVSESSCPAMFARGYPKPSAAKVLDVGGLLHHVLTRGRSQLLQHMRGRLHHCVPIRDEEVLRVCVCLAVMCCART